MSYFIDICFICFKYSKNLTNIRSKDTNGTTIDNKLKYFLPGLEFKSSIPKYICAKCGRNLSKIYEFKQKCVQNLTKYEKYAQQITTTDGSYKYLSVVLSPDFVCNEEISNENILELQSEMNADLVNSDEVFIKEEINELLLDDKFIPLLHEVKIENPKADVTWYNNENIIAENIQISDNYVPFSTDNEYTSELEEECQDSEKKNSYYENLEQNDKELYKYQICNKSFKVLSDLGRHQLTRRKKKSYICEVCNKSFCNSSHLKAHHVVHTGEKPFTCEVCNRSFTQLIGLQRHCSIHTGEKPFTCKICERSFRQIHGLRQHQLIHSDEKPYTCEVCNKSFRHLSALKRHKLLHTPVKLFTCEVCNKSFRVQQYLKEHKSIHTGVRPFICEVCNKSFRQPIHLKRHYLIHKKTFTCPICNDSFPLLDTLKKHKLIHIDEDTLHL